MLKKTSSWGDWGWLGDEWGSWFDIIWKREKQRKKRKALKETIEERAKESFASIKVWFNANSDSSFSKQRKFSVKLDDNAVKKLNVDELFNVYERMPDITDWLDSYIMYQRLLWENRNFNSILEDSDLCKGGKAKTLSDIDKFFSWDITYKELKDNFDEEAIEKLFKRKWDPSKAINENNVWTKEKFRWRTIWDEQQKKFINLINQKVTIKSSTERSESLSRGKRINKSYIQWTSYKPLSFKETTVWNKKNLLIIIDWSWSMGCESHIGGRTIEEAHSFASALFHCWKFNVIKTIHHDSSWWYDVNEFYKKWIIKVAIGWGEWFDRIDDNLDDDFLKWVDYIVTLTDLCIGTSEQEWLHEYIKKRKHMVISFQGSWDLKWMPVRTIKTMKDMVNALVTLVW